MRKVITGRGRARGGGGVHTCKHAGSIMLSGCNGLRMIGYISRNAALHHSEKEDVFHCFCIFHPLFFILTFLVLQYGP